jgi:hypothetical protein
MEYCFKVQRLRCEKENISINLRTEMTTPNGFGLRLLLLMFFVDNDETQQVYFYNIYSEEHACKQSIHIF